MSYLENRGRLKALRGKKVNMTILHRRAVTFPKEVTVPTRREIGSYSRHPTPIRHLEYQRPYPERKERRMVEKEKKAPFI